MSKKNTFAKILDRFMGRVWLGEVIFEDGTSSGLLYGRSSKGCIDLSRLNHATKTQPTLSHSDVDYKVTYDKKEKEFSLWIDEREVPLIMNIASTKELDGEGHWFGEYRHLYLVNLKKF